MWEARHQSAWANFRHEIAGVVRGARRDRRNLGRDFCRLLLGGFRRREAFTRILAVLRPKTEAFRPSAATQRSVAQIRETGFTEPLPLITSAQLDEINAFLREQPYADPFRRHLGEFRYPEAPSPESNQAYYSDETLLRAPHLLGLMNHPAVLEVAETLLGCKPLIENLICGWYFTGRQMEKGVQRFHRDFDTPRFIKLFLYLTDIDETSGPHIYVRGSQSSDKLLLRRYIDDDEVDSAFGSQTVAKIVGRAGTSFLVDTFGVHKGGLPTSRPRLIFSCQYNVWPSPFAPREPILRADGLPYDRYINRAYLK